LLTRLDIDPDKLTPAQLDKIAEHLIQRVVGDDPAAVADMKKRLEAGEPVDVTDFEEIQEPGQP
jgi:hypothetical protein